MIASGLACSQYGRAAPGEAPGAASVSVRGFTPWLARAARMSSGATSPRSTRISPSFLSPSFCAISTSRSWGVVSFFIRIRMSPSRSLLRARVSSSSTRWAGAWVQKSCLYLGLASQKQRKQKGQTLEGFLASSEHQTARRASNSPRQFQQLTGYDSGTPELPISDIRSLPSRLAHYQRRIKLW